MTPELADKLWQIAKDAGILLSILAIVIAIVFYIVRSIGEDRKRSAELNKQLASIVGSFSQLFDKINERLAKQDEQLDLLRLTVENTSTAKQQAIEHNATATITSQKLIELNTQALIELRADYLKSWNEALDKMGAARGSIIGDVNKHTDEAHRLTGEAIAAARNENKATHAGQAEELETRMNNLRDAIEQNGKDRKAQYTEIQDTLATMAKTLAALQEDMKAVKAQAPGDTMVAIKEKVERLSTEFEALKEKLSPPPQVDPLANLPTAPQKTDS